MTTQTTKPLPFTTLQQFETSNDVRNCIKYYVIHPNRFLSAQRLVISLYGR